MRLQFGILIERLLSRVPDSMKRKEKVLKLRKKCLTNRKAHGNISKFAVDASGLNESAPSRKNDGLAADEKVKKVLDKSERDMLQ